MTTNIDNSQRRAAKIAGWSYLASFAVVVFANYVLLGPLIIPRNAVDTARNILAHQTQFRIALTLFLTYSVGAVILAGALYIILKPINHYLALLGALFRVVFAMSWLLSAIHLLGALRWLGNHSVLAGLRSRSIAGPGQNHHRLNFRRLLCWSAVFWIGRHHLRLVMAPVGIYPARIVDLWRNCIRLVCALRLRVSHFS